MTQGNTFDNEEYLLAQRRAKRRMMREMLRARPARKPCLGFRWSAEEDSRIDRAKAAARIYMESYGKPPGTHCDVI